METKTRPGKNCRCTIRIRTTGANSIGDVFDCPTCGVFVWGGFTWVPEQPLEDAELTAGVWAGLHWGR